MNDQYASIQRIYFSIGSVFSGYWAKEWLCHEDQALKIRYNVLNADFEPKPVPTEVSKETWKRVCECLRCADVLSWDFEYHNPEILDGTQWCLELKFDDGFEFESSGSQGFPDTFHIIEKGLAHDNHL